MQNSPIQKRIHVAVGVIVDAHKQILIAKRHGHLHQGGKWEFPGGKVESNETVTQALARELQEEVNLVIHDSTPFMEISHNYPDKHVHLDIHIVTEFSNTAKGIEGQEIQWIPISQLSQFEFPDANQPILDKILATL